MHLLSCFIWEETRRLFWHSCEKNVFFLPLWWLQRAFCDEKKWCLGVWIVYEKGNFSSYIMTSFLLCCCFFSILNWPVQNMMLLCLFTVFHACICTYIFLLAVYKDVCLQEPQTFFSLEHPCVRLYECFFFSPFLRKMAKSRESWWEMFCFVFVLWHRRKYFSVKLKLCII